MARRFTKLKIENNTDHVLVHREFISKSATASGDTNKHVKAYDHHSYVFSGGTGYIAFNHHQMGDITVSFSNPDIGACKINVGDQGASTVYEHMTDHYYDIVEVNLSGVLCTFTNPYDYDNHTSLPSVNFHYAEI